MSEDSWRRGYKLVLCDSCGMPVQPPDEGAWERYRYNFPNGAARGEVTQIACNRCYSEIMARYAVDSN